MQTPLPQSWVNRIFDELKANYGSRFVDMWRTGEKGPDGLDAGLSLAMAAWADRLGGFKGHPERIKRALASLPQHPPTLPEFVNLCRQQAQDYPLALGAPKASPDEVAPQVEAMMRAAQKEAPTDKLSWAHRVPTITGPWSKAIMDLVEEGDSRFAPIFAKHYASGAIKGERATRIAVARRAD